MEARKIIIVSTANQSKKVIMSSATTLSELKADLREHNISYDGMTFYEGTSKTELKTDESVLPHDVPYKGTITNELVFMLTNSNKKIRSGAMSRKEVYNKITELGLQDECKKKFGRNFTQCTTTDLISLVEKASKKAAPASAPKVETPTEVVDNKARKAITALTTILFNNDIIDCCEKDEVMSILGGEMSFNMPSKPNTESPYSDSELAEMFEGMNN